MARNKNSSNDHRETFLTAETWLNGELIVNDDTAVYQAIYNHNSQHPEEEVEEEETSKPKRRKAVRQPTAKELAEKAAIETANDQDLKKRNIK